MVPKNSSIKLAKSYCYDDDPENCNEFGRLYEWASALKACPEGTRLPNASDLAELKKNPNVASRLNLKFGGFRNAKGGYELKDVRADMWTASEIYSNAKYWYVSVNDDGMIENKFSKKAAMAVRCIVGDLENDVRIGSIVDDRDDQVYPVVTVGKQTWMAQNLNIALSGSYCYNDDMENCEKYGRLYVYSDAKEICPEGFYLPSDAEWQTLKNYISDHGNGRLATMLKSSDKWNSVGKDLWGMNILPSGSRSDMGEYDRLGERAYFWSSSEKNADSAYHWAVVDNDESFSRNIVSKQSYRAIRCVSDEMISIDSKPQHRTMSYRVFEVVE